MLGICLIWILIITYMYLFRFVLMSVFKILLDHALLSFDDGNWLLKYACCLPNWWKQRWIASNSTTNIHKVILHVINICDIIASTYQINKQLLVIDGNLWFSISVFDKQTIDFSCLKVEPCEIERVSQVSGQLGFTLEFFLVRRIIDNVHFPCG